MKTVLKKCVLEFGDDWDLHVGKVLADMCWHTSNATTISPFEVVFGRRPMLPSFLEFGTFNVDNLSLRAMNERKVGDCEGSFDWTSDSQQGSVQWSNSDASCVFRCGRPCDAQNDSFV